MSIGKKIKKYRTEKGVTQTELAESIGSYQKNISTYEKDEVIPSAAIIKKIADKLEVSLDYLLSDDQHLIGDARILKVCKDLDRLAEADKVIMLSVIQAFLRDMKLKGKKSL
jgi:transcriptional regulator with XRE-family HTH domain